MNPATLLARAGMAVFLLVLPAMALGGEDVEVAAIPAAVKVRVQEGYGKLPLQFEANQGQTDGKVKFLSRGSGYSLFLTSTEAVLVLRQDAKSHSPHPSPRWGKGERRSQSERSPATVLRMKLVGANPAPRVSGLEELPGKVNYYIGNDPRKWRTNIPTYAKVKYQNVYPGVDLVYYGNQRQLEYDFIVAPGANPNSIKLSFHGARGIHIDKESGDLVLEAANGEARLRRPKVYQFQKSEIDGRYVKEGDHQIAFRIAAYDAHKPLVIDPVLSYSTYLGGSADDQALAIAVDAAGNAYIAGQTASSNFPTTSGAFQTTFQGGALPGLDGDAFVTKLNPTGTALVYSTYLGGSTSIERANGVAVDSAGNAYVTGQTNSTDFPVTPGAFQTTFGGSGFTGCCAPGDAFVTKLNPTGSALVYSTYLGGSGADGGFGIAVDSAGNAYVAGQTHSTNFPVTAGAFQSSFRGSYGCGGNTNSGFVTKLNASGTAVVYSTYLGGGGFDGALSIAIDGAGNAYATGFTSSSDFPVTPGAFQTSTGGGTCPGGMDAFVTKLNSTGGGVYSTYLGGSGDEEGIGIAVDASGNAYVTGFTQSTNFPTASPFQATFGGVRDAFVAKLNPTGSALVYSTYLGGSGDDFGQGIALDATGNASVTGFTASSNFPTTPGAFQATFGGVRDAFVAKLNPTGSALVYSTYLGGSGEDGGFGIAVDSAGNAYVTGRAVSPNFPTTPGAFQTTFSGGTFDAFVAKITDVITVITVGIDIKPGSLPNSINPTSQGKIPVAILSAAGFNALADVDQGSLKFGRTGDELSLAFCDSSPQDVNGDGLPDLVCHFHTQTAAFQSGDTQGILKGHTVGGTPFIGTDSVRIVPPK